MPITIENARQDFDLLVWDNNDEQWEEAQKLLSRKSVCRQLETLVVEKFGKPATWISPMIIGGFNNLYRIQVEGVSSDVLVRRPSVSQAQFPWEKTLQEAATGRYIKQNTSIPTPKIYFYGNSLDVGPFMIIERIENKSTLSHLLTIPGLDRSITHVLNPNISSVKLEAAYFNIAKIVFELSQHRFPLIGSLNEAENGTISIQGRPITQNMNDMLQLANIPSSILGPENKTFKSANEYYVHLAQMHLAQLVFQQNDLIKSVTDCKNKYVARQLFLQLAQQGRLSTFGFADDDWSAQAKTQTTSPMPLDADGFGLYGDDLRPGNMLVNDTDNIVSVIDWEFTYAAPAQFGLDPPWYLLLESPDMWDAGIEDWAEKYGARLETWLGAMEIAESASCVAKAEDPGRVGGEAEKGKMTGKTPPLSSYMRQSWETGRFWLTYAATRSWAFDTVYWTFLDEQFFGPREGAGGEEKRGHDGGGPVNDDSGGELWETRIHLLGVPAREGMDAFVQRKMEEGRERKVVVWGMEEARRRLAEVLYDAE